MRAVQAGYVNFYPDDAVNPYVALAARGPWVVTPRARCCTTPAATACSASATRPRRVLAAMAKPQVMANIMTPSLSQLRFERALRAAIGHTRGGCPYDEVPVPELRFGIGRRWPRASPTSTPS